MSTRKPTAIISTATMERAAEQTVRYTAIGVWLLSLAGTVITFNGGPPALPRFWLDLSPIAILAGLMVQGFLTVMEWGSRRHRTNPRYWVPLLFDISLTFAGWAPIVEPWLASAFVPARLPDPATAVLGLVGVLLLSIFAAYYPEQNLVD